MTRIGLNGFGRIGRAVARIATLRDDVELVVVNELVDDIDNHVYLFKYDSLYGRFDRSVEKSSNGRGLVVDGQPVAVHSEHDPNDVPWKDYNLDVLVEATGVDAIARRAHDLVRSGAVPKVVVTHAHPEVDHTIVAGVNDQTYLPEEHHVVSTSICDANAVAPVLDQLNKAWGVESCFVTTLHPWLSYQNLLDGSLASISSPGHSWKDYGLGRASMLSLIPKDTTAGHATLAVLPELRGKVEASSFRVPTHIVSASDMTVVLGKKTTAEEINELFAKRAAEIPNILGYETDHLVSIDYLQTNQSCIVDARRTRVIGRKVAKIVAWYDNEWGYSNRVVDGAVLVATGVPPSKQGAPTASAPQLGGAGN